MKVKRKQKINAMKIRILTLALVALFATSAAWAQKPERGQRNPEQKDRMPRHEQMAERRGNFFTEEQQEQIKTIRLETAKEMQPLRNQLNELEARQQTLSTAEKADMNAIYKNIDKISEVRADIQKLMAKQRQDIRSLLNEEQKLKFDSMKGHMHDRRDDGFRNRRVPRENAG